MSKKMLIDASHPEETRVVVVNGTRVEELDFESQNKRQLRGNVYLARVTRVEPSLQAAFVEFGGNRHGFLAFGEIHPDYYDLPHEDRMALIDAEEAENRADDAEEDDEDEPEATPATAQIEDDEDEGDDPLRPAANSFALANRRKEKALPAAASKPKKITQKAPAKGKTKKAVKPAPVEIEEDENTPDPTRPAASSWNVSNKLVFSNFDIEKDPTSPAADNFKHADALKVAEYDPSIIPEDDDEDEDAIDTEMLEDAADDDDKEVAEEQANMDRKRKKRISRRRYKIQEVVKRGQIMLVQAVKEERGNKGAALTTYLSLAGRYCVLMPNTPRGGGISRKIANGSDRKRLKSIMSELEVPKGMGVIVRTAGAKRTQDEIKHDYDYLARLWETIRNNTLKSFAPALIHQEGDLVKRSIRDMYNKEISEILVQGDDAYQDAHNFIDMLMPSHIDKVKNYQDDIPLFLRYQVEQQIEASLDPVAQLKSGGYLVIHPTEALVSVDVNSGRSTKERNVERTALKTNLEAAEEVARQMRLRDLAGLVVIDFIDMDESRNNRAVEKKMKDALSRDRARVQMGRISQFGLMEISRQRRRRSLLEGSSASCEHCAGVGRKRTIESSALKAIRAVEEEGIRGKAKRVRLKVSPNVAVYLFNEKRDLLQHVDAQFNMFTELVSDDTLHRPEFTIERVEEREGKHEDPLEAIKKAHKAEQNRRPKQKTKSDNKDDEEQPREGRNKRRRRRGGKRNDEANAETSDSDQSVETPSAEGENGEEQPRKRRRRRGRRGGRGKRGPNEGGAENTSDANVSENTDSNAEAIQTPKSDDSHTENGSETKPKRSRNRNRRNRKKAPDANSDATNVEAPKGETKAIVADVKSDTAPDTPKRKRTRSKAPAPAKADDAGKTDAPKVKAEATEKPKRVRAKAPAPKKAKAEASEKTESQTKAKPKAKPTPKAEKPKRVRAKAPAPKKTEAPAAKVETQAPKPAPAPSVESKPETATPSKKEKSKGGWWSKRNPFK